MEVKIDEIITMHFWKAFPINKQIYASCGVAKLFCLDPFIKSPNTPFSTMTLLFGVIQLIICKLHESSLLSILWKYWREDGKDMLFWT